MAAGGDLEVYWSVYTQHNRGHIEDVMAPYKIGIVSPADMKAITAETHFDAAQYADNPEPYPDLLVNTRYPYNAEGRLAQLTDSFFTPAGKHFVRNHCAVPNIDPNEYRLTINGYDVQETVFTLHDLKTKFQKVDVTTVIQCNGNRREDFHYLDGKNPAFGPPHWVAGAIGCATWSGVRLRDVLKAAGMDVDAISLGQRDAHPNAQQIGLLGYDHDECGNQYCCSFPFDKAIEPFGDVIIAYEMNGEPIPRPYGYPVRCIVPGHAGARNCKYLEMVTVTDEPCRGNSNWKQYAVHAPNVPVRKIAEFERYGKELKQDPPVQEMPVQSMITSPSAGDIIAACKTGAKSVKVKGIAWGGGGQGINRVDVSLNNGSSWVKADVLDKPITQRRKSQWSWSFFEQEIPIPQEMRAKLEKGEAVDLVLTSKALNTAWNVQPENPEPNWNAHGCCVNHWYRVPVTVCPKASCDIKAPEGDYANKPSGGRFATRFVNTWDPKEAKARVESTKAGTRCTCGNNCKEGEGCLRPVFEKLIPKELRCPIISSNLAARGRPEEEGKCRAGM
jgi:sulfite oxidase